MDFFSALKALQADGSLVVEYQGRRYRLIIREGVIRMVVDETRQATPLLPEEAKALLHELIQRGRDAPARVSWVVPTVDPLSRAIFVPTESLLA